MVAKGHHFEDVRVAAVVDADTGLGLPDFRAEERTFQLVTQLAGRSGREAPGPRDRPDLPARRPADRARRAARGGGVPRRASSTGAALLGYPPFRHLVRIVVAGPTGERPRAGPRELKTELARSGVADLLGPAPLLRLRGRHRAQLLAKTDNPRLVTSPAGRLLAAAVPADAPRRADRGRRRGSAGPPDYDSASWARSKARSGTSSSTPSARRGAGIALAQVRQYPDPVLRMEAREVEEFDDALAALVERMGRLMEEARGVGLAAPQIGILQRVLVYQTRGGRR